MIFNESVYRTKVVCNIILHSVVNFYSCWTNCLVDIYVLQMSMKSQGIFHYLNSTEV
jgi:hypothetical protein